MIYRFRTILFKFFFFINKYLLGKKGLNPYSYRNMYFAFLSKFKKDFFFIKYDTKIYYDPLNSGVGWGAYFNGDFEQHEIEICKQFIKSDSIIFDIGANIGSHSIAFSKMATNGKVFSFEPSVKTYKWLLKNTERNENIVCNNIAFSNESELIKFYECENDVMSGLSDTKRSNILFVKEVVSETGDSYVERLKLDNLDFIKIDVEGFEENVFKGFKKSIAKFKPVIFCEIYKGQSSNLNPQSTIDLIRQSGYSVNVIKEKELELSTLHSDQFPNYIFIPV